MGVRRPVAAFAAHAEPAARSVGRLEAAGHAEAGRMALLAIAVALKSLGDKRVPGVRVLAAIPSRAVAGMTRSARLVAGEAIVFRQSGGQQGNQALDGLTRWR